MTRYPRLRRARPRLKSVVRGAKLRRALELEDAACLPEPPRGELEVLLKYSLSAAGSVAHRGRRRLQPRRSSCRPSFAGPAHSDNRMTLAIYTSATEGM